MSLLQDDFLSNNIRYVFIQCNFFSMVKKHTALAALANVNFFVGKRIVVAN